MLLLADGGEPPTVVRDFPVTEPKSRMTGKQLRALREKHGLTQQQVAQLCHMKVSGKRGKGGEQSNQVGNWENDRKPIPDAMAELIRVKLYLLEKQLVSFDELIQYSLQELIADIYS